MIWVFIPVPSSGESSDPLIALIIFGQLINKLVFVKIIVKEFNLVEWQEDPKSWA
jgi:hypothetical protein